MANDMLQTLILRRIAAVKNEVIAHAIGCDPSRVSRIVAGDSGVRLHEMEAFLAVLGIRGIESGGDYVVTSTEEDRALRVLARKALKLDGEGRP